MRVCIVSFKECWQDAEGCWTSYGGFPAQMKAISSLFDETDLVICSGRPREGGMPLPAAARIVALRNPPGRGLRRKLAVLAKFPYYVGEIRRHVRAADAVHVPVPGDIALLGLLMALLYRKPLVARFCGSWRVQGRQTLANRFTRAIMSRFAGGRNVMLATGLADDPPSERMHWIFSTAMSRDEVQALRPELDRGLSDRPRAIFAGRLAQPKGVDHLIRALAKLRKEGFTPLPHLTVVGDGPERAHLMKMAKAKGLSELIEFTGQLDRRRLSERMMQADFCLHGSLTEGLCKAWLDSMAHGLPVVAYAAGAAPAVLGEDGERGWLAPVGDVDALARRIRSVISEPRDWPALRRRCRAYAEERTLESWSVVIGELCAAAWGVTLEEGRLTA